jgi:hypothetical protein
MLDPETDSILPLRTNLLYCVAELSSVGIEVIEKLPFDIRKLQKSLKSACLAAGVDDPIFVILLSRRVHRAVLSIAGVAPIKLKRRRFVTVFSKNYAISPTIPSAKEIQSRLNRRTHCVKRGSSTKP